MHRKAFYHLLKRYLDGDCTEEEKKIVEQWYELLDHEPAMSEEEVKKTLQLLWPKIKDQTIPVAPVFQAPVRGKVIPIWLRRMSVAAVAACLIGAYWFWQTGKGNDYSTFKEEKSIAHLSTTENVTTTNDTVYLKDKSMVVLEPNAKLYYPDSFNSTKREVYLEGNAFFKVTKNPNRPFYVYSNNIVTQVLGTSFFIKNNAVTNDVEVSVRTGKVAVYENEQTSVKDKKNIESNGVILKPNQKVIYNRGDHHFRTTLVEAPLPILAGTQSDDKIMELNFVFEEEPISQVLLRLEEAYHIEMVLENDGLTNCLFSGDIKGQDLFDQLEIICQSVQATYEIRGTRILIKGTGCN
jgi:transmembrane sensor